MSFREDLKRNLGYPQLEVELHDTSDCGEAREKDDYDFIMQRTLSRVRTYFPMEYIVRKDVPSNGGVYGEGYVDISDDGFLAISDVYVLKPKQGNANVLLPWSVIRLWEKTWLGASDFAAFDMLLWRNELAMLYSVTNTVFSWQQNGNQIYLTNVPSFSTGIGIRGLKGVDSLDDICNSLIEYDIALKYATGLGKQKLGNFYRKHKVDGIDMPGDELITEGKEMVQEAQADFEEHAVYPGGLHGGMGSGGNP